MVDLAKEAFSTNNFDLAVEIYERIIKERGPNVELYLGLGDSYASSGHLQKAFQAYANAYRLGIVTADHLNHLVTALIHAMRKDLQEENARAKTEDFLACEICKALWTDPVTLPCGHTFCRKCLEKTQCTTCKKCNAVITTKCWILRTNVLLNSAIEKWFPKEIEAARLKAEGNHYFEAGHFKEAILKYSQAYVNGMVFLISLNSYK